MSDHNKPSGADDDAKKRAPADAHTRRDFLKASTAVTGASLLAGCLTDTYQVAPLESEPPPSFDHVIVVMFENRSLDNVLGYLYPPGQVPRNQKYNGLAGVTYTNPVPDFFKDGPVSVATRLSPGTDADLAGPNPNPGEDYPHVTVQLFNKPNAPSPSPPVTMTGFVQDYGDLLSKRSGHPSPTFDEFRAIMDGYSPEQLPVISTLAREFAVYDAWFAAAPTQTFCNRAFFHASSSAAQVSNSPYLRWLTNDEPTIFNRLEDANIPWKIYFDSTQVVSLTGLINTRALRPYWKTRFATMDAFYADLAKGTLPAYAFVEPRTFFNHNDYHPPAPILPLPGGHPSDVRAGEFLLHTIYTRFRASSHAQNSLLLVTFDEHGGTFDHVAPPAAVPPHDPPQPDIKYGFLFDRLGVRVPTIAISAYTAAGTVINRPIHHGALIRELCARYDLPHLTERDRNAPDLSDARNLTLARDPSTWPVTVPRPVPPADDIDLSSPGLAMRPLNDLEQSVVGLAFAYFLGREPEASDIPATIGAAYAKLSQIAAGAFGPD